MARENEKVQDMTSDVSYSILTSNANLAKDATKVSLFAFHVVYSYIPGK